MDGPTLSIDRNTFAALVRDYTRAWPVAVCAVNRDGVVALGCPPCDGCNRPACIEARLVALRETRRWGEPTVSFCPGNRLLWAVPLMHNREVTGGLLASLAEADAFTPNPERPVPDLRRACVELRELAEQFNLTNAAELELRRREYVDEQQRAYAIHSYKTASRNTIRTLYLREEPALFSAIRSGDRSEAREILNRILMIIHCHAGDRLHLVKSIFMELVVSMCRTAVEAGGSPEALLGANFKCMSDLSEIHSLEVLAGWLARTLEHMMDAIEKNRRRDPGSVLTEAMAYMERHYAEPISRDIVARAVHVSPSHFSCLIAREAGATFTELLNRIRVDRAAELLAREGIKVAEVALRTGFTDQSYFTKVFKRYRQVTPRRYRARLGLGTWIAPSATASAGSGPW